MAFNANLIPALTCLRRMYMVGRPHFACCAANNSRAICSTSAGADNESTALGLLAESAHRHC
jgi:hypothetical protein